jgi:protocatechuate 3,4-dioxygenase beta subunit
MIFGPIVKMHTSLFLAAAVFASSAFGHPGPHPEPSVGEKIRRAGISSRCEASVAAMNQKRWERTMEKRSLAARDIVYHDINETTFVNHQHPFYHKIQNDTCVLTPEVTAGPYVWPRSQTFRQDMTENEAGVPLWLDIGVIDTTTCEPLPNVLVDLWHCNSTGYYSSFEGHDPDTPFLELLAQLNITFPPVGNETIDIHTGNTTFLRGMWPTDEEGVMEMKTVFPGFYIQRAVHIHAQVHTNWAIGNNGTIIADETVSTGQLFFDEDLTEQIVSLYPYSTHTTINRTLNSDDGVWVDEATGGFNPLVDVIPLDGHDVTKGMVGYITIGVNSSAVQDGR